MDRLSSAPDSVIEAPARRLKVPLPLAVSDPFAGSLESDAVTV